MKNSRRRTRSPSSGCHHLLPAGENGLPTDGATTINHFLPAGAVFRIMRQAAPIGASEDA
ncbi:hypothetical protein B5K08_25210 [Rhizobium leguminosarum bv. trifolii]|uniref:Uncharacterized protein n=1 Tax=Rhizobium leguminosarum bv. trifolii TaxID=386 RepID=A0A3E1B6R8_RHILT|nr:hypothetical protein B5K08_25210 [Rhizobium leguminosarum bv. trifolii]RFB85878.1 hypothetical protein B5K10_26200 [Rhizobium leguminosarum bv. trifolii]